MLLFNINGHQYRSPEAWSEVTISKAAALHELIDKQMPDQLKDYYKIGAIELEQDREKALQEWVDAGNDALWIKILPEFYGKVLEVLTDIPQEIISKIFPGDRTTFYKQYCEWIVLGIYYGATNYQTKGILFFKHKEEKFYLPITRNILGIERPMADRTAIEFTEVADLELFSKQMAGGRYEIAANIISILCRPKLPNGQLEPYDEEKCLNRAEEFKQLGMDIAFEVFFCLNEHILISRQVSLISQLNRLIKDQTDLLVSTPE